MVELEQDMNFLPPCTSTYSSVHSWDSIVSWMVISFLPCVLIMRLTFCGNYSQMILNR